MAAVQIGRQILDEDPHTRIYHVRVCLTEQPREAGIRNESVENPFLDAVLHINGVAIAMVTPYALLVSKGPQFDWTEIEPSIKVLLASFTVPLCEDLVQ